MQTYCIRSWALLSSLGLGCCSPTREGSGFAAFRVVGAGHLCSLESFLHVGSRGRADAAASQLLHSYSNAHGRAFTGAATPAPRAGLVRRWRWSSGGARMLRVDAVLVVSLPADRQAHGCVLEPEWQEHGEPSLHLLPRVPEL